MRHGQRSRIQSQLNLPSQISGRVNEADNTSKQVGLSDGYLLGKSSSEGEEVNSVSEEGISISESRSKCQDLVQADINFEYYYGASALRQNQLLKLSYWRSSQGFKPLPNSLKSVKIHILHHFPEQAGCLFHRKIKFYCGMGILPARKGINE